MPHVSRNKLSKETEKELIQMLNAVLANIKSQDNMITFITSLLSTTEKLMLAKRFAIIVLLDQGLSDSQIAMSLHVTRMTVSKMRYYYESRGKGFIVGLEVLKKLEFFEDFKKALLSVGRYAARAAGGYVKPNPFD